MKGHEPPGIPGGGENARHWRHAEIATTFAGLDVTPANAQADKFELIARCFEEGLLVFARDIRAASATAWSGASADAATQAVGAYVRQARELVAALYDLPGVVRSAAAAIVATKYAIPAVVTDADAAAWSAGRPETGRAASMAEDEARTAMHERYVEPFGELSGRIPLLPELLEPTAARSPGSGPDDRDPAQARSGLVRGQQGPGLHQVTAVDPGSATDAATVPDRATPSGGIASAAADVLTGAHASVDPAGTSAVADGSNGASVMREKFSSAFEKPGSSVVSDATVSTAFSDMSPGPGAESTSSAASETVAAASEVPDSTATGAGASSGSSSGSCPAGGSGTSSTDPTTSGGSGSSGGSGTSSGSGTSGAFGTAGGSGTAGGTSGSGTAGGAAAGSGSPGARTSWSSAGSGTSGWSAGSGYDGGTGRAGSAGGWSGPGGPVAPGGGGVSGVSSPGAGSDGRAPYLGYGVRPPLEGTGSAGISAGPVRPESGARVELPGVPGPVRPGGGQSVPGTVGAVVGGDVSPGPTQGRMTDRHVHCPVGAGAPVAAEDEGEHRVPEYLVTRANAEALLGTPRPAIAGGVIGGDAAPDEQRGPAAQGGRSCP